MREIMEEWMEEGVKVLIVGDFNVRIGRWQMNKEGEAE